MRTAVHVRNPLVTVTSSPCHASPQQLIPRRALVKLCRMAHSRLTLPLFLLTFATALRADDLPALHVSGTKLVDEKGAPVQLRGVNFGCWLLLEPHFLGMSFGDEHSLWEGLGQRVGKDKAAEIREALRAAWISADDFHNVKRLGLNHVRVPFPSTLLASRDTRGVD